MQWTRRSLSMNSKGRCPRRYTLRKAYTVQKTGTRVGAACVRSTTRARETRKAFVDRTRVRMTKRLRGIPMSRRGIPTSCPPGTIVRDPYVRVRMGKRQFVPAACIRDVGNPGKGIPTGAPGIGPLRKGDLKRFGYTEVTTMSEGRRHLALATAVKEYGSLTVWRKLNAIYIYTKKTAPASSAVFKADRDWINTKYGINAF